MAEKISESLKEIKKRKEVKGNEKQMQHADCIEAALRKWEEMPPLAKEIFVEGVRNRVFIFLQWWDSLKAIEKKYNINVIDIAKEIRYKYYFEAGQILAKKSEKHGIRDLYNACLSGLEGIAKGRVWFELNDKRLRFDITWCQPHQYFKEFGKSDEEIKELAEFFCLQDEARLRGFNPKLKVFDKPCILMKGDSQCSFLVEDHGVE